MNSNAAKVAIGVGAVAVAVVLLIVLKGDSDEGSETSNASGKVPAIVIEGGKPVGGVKALTYNEGERIRFEVRSDVSDEIHVHGYDEMKDVEAGGSVRFDFPATLEGKFEAELEERGEQIAELTVNP
jgi:hypothetical protein